MRHPVRTFGLDFLVLDVLAVMGLLARDTSDVGEVAEEEEVDGSGDISLGCSSPDERGSQH